uniref:Uncharacterized protein n=1 Tax=Musa acuminata subsp. malaccensis TaxID=214687 RepID=A0A804ID94_MUSAM
MGLGLPSATKSHSILLRSVELIPKAKAIMSNNNSSVQSRLLSPL